jgi:hypothetical protein
LTSTGPILFLHSSLIMKPFPHFSTPFPRYFFKLFMSSWGDHPVSVMFKIVLNFSLFYIVWSRNLCFVQESNMHTTVFTPIL